MADQVVVDVATLFERLDNLKGAVDKTATVLESVRQTLTDLGARVDRENDRIRISETTIHHDALIHEAEDNKRFADIDTRLKAIQTGLDAKVPVHWVTAAWDVGRQVLPWCIAIGGFMAHTFHLYGM